MCQRCDVLYDAPLHIDSHTHTHTHTHTCIVEHCCVNGVTCHTTYLWVPSLPSTTAAQYAISRCVCVCVCVCVCELRVSLPEARGVLSCCCAKLYEQSSSFLNQVSWLCKETDEGYRDGCAIIHTQSVLGGCAVI